jgi:hypothetical protein
VLAGQAGEERALNWSDEWWIKLYTRDTTSWLMLTWQARAVLLFLLRKVNRAGELDLGEHGTRGLCAHLGMPWTDLERPIGELIADGCVSVTDTGMLVIPNFATAQEAAMSNKARQAKWRNSHADHNATLRESNGASTRGRQSETNRNPKTRSDKTRVDQSPECARIWELQNQLRQQSIPGAQPLRATPKALARVAKVLEDGHTVEDCEHVLRRYAAEARARPRESAQWFDGVTNWRPENFARALGKPPLALGSTLPVPVDAVEYRRQLAEAEAKPPARLSAWTRNQEQS